MSGHAEVTEAHRSLARRVYAAEEYLSNEDGPQLIADSEARVTAELRAARDSDFEVFHAMRMKLTAACGDPFKLHDEALDALIAERDQLRAALVRARDWGISSKGFSARQCLVIADWVDAGMKGELPPLPYYYLKL
jgi:hypothetical protein